MPSHGKRNFAGLTEDLDMGDVPGVSGGPDGIAKALKRKFREIQRGRMAPDAGEVGRGAGFEEMKGVVKRGKQGSQPLGET